MSQEQAKKFIERMKLANAEGYDFTEEEIKSVSAELSDAEVSAVAGGEWGCLKKHGCYPYRYA